MKFHVVYPRTGNGQSPVRVAEQTTGREVGWINRFLDREYVRRLADKTLRTYAHNLLHFVRWWESVHHTGEVVEGDLAYPDRPSTIVWPSRIAPYATSSPAPPVRSPGALIKPFCRAGQWALDGRVWRSAGCG
jgi:hypothetical protein